MESCYEKKFNRFVRHSFVDLKYPICSSLSFNATKFQWKEFLF